MAAAGYEDVVRVLIKGRADPLAIDGVLMESAVHHAAREGHADVVRALMGSRFQRADNGRGGKDQPMPFLDAGATIRRNWPMHAPFPLACVLFPQKQRLQSATRSIKGARQSTRVGCSWAVWIVPVVPSSDRFPCTTSRSQPSCSLRRFLAAAIAGNIPVAHRPIAEPPHPFVTLPLHLFQLPSSQNFFSAAAWP